MSEVFRNVLNASLQGGVVIAVVLLLRLMLRSAPKKYVCLLWLLALIRLLVPFSFESPLSLQPQEQIVTQKAWEDLYSYGRVFPENAPTEAPLVGAPVTSEELEAASGVTVTVKTEINWAAIAPYLWIAGVAALGAYSLISYLRLRRRVREAVRTDGNVYECYGLDTAFVLGYFRPRIYIPAGIANAGLILAHERAHIRRGDHWFQLVGFIALAVHWFNPLAWVAYVLLCRDLEMACDQAVVRDLDVSQRKAYSAALLACAAHRTSGACPVAFGEVSVKQRIVGILNYRRPRFWVTILAVSAAAFVAVCFLTDPAAPDESDLHLERCRSALEAFQSSENGCVTVENQFSGEALGDSSRIVFYRDGEDWLEYILNPSVDQSIESWYLHKAGEDFERLISTIYDPGNGESWDSGWIVSPNEKVVPPWLWRFDWDGAQIQFVDAPDEDKVMFVVQGSPYGTNYPDDVIMQYAVTFRFQGGTDELESVTLQFTEMHTMYVEMEKVIGVTNVISTITPQAMDAAQVTQTIDQHYREATGNT